MILPEFIPNNVLHNNAEREQAKEVLRKLLEQIKEYERPDMYDESGRKTNEYVRWCMDWGEDAYPDWEPSGQGFS